MSLYTDTPATALGQISRGFFTGCRLFSKLLVTTATVVIAGICLHKAGKGGPGESAEAVNTHHDIRRNIALSVGGATDRAISEQSDAGPSWKSLMPVANLVGDPAGLESRVEVRQVAGVTSYQIIIGPYDPEISRSLKGSSGWVNLRLLQANGGPVAGFESGLKIPLSGFEYHQEDGLPVGWIHRGSAVTGKSSEGQQVEQFKLGWVLPSSASVQRPIQVTLH